ncbi:hypothetical protein NA57DRAFT_71873 [Rhizodiscina lignyota]|uniref:Uncharacterized protein n=1 Tax=Rhizodiscina lignyota TaxID=1504668 RepID=A0A9P4IMX9_9PEZI|nr:hypothetical protein NA57DRAFT_71873 [Rhizodiscina lignyota]
MSDAYKCFSYLKENSPRWLSDLSGLEKHVEDKQTEISQAEDCPAELITLPVRNGSVASIRERDISSGFRGAQSSTDRSTQSPEDSAHPSASRRRNVLIKRKKPSPSMLTDNMSGPPKFRTRSMIIVYYDAEIQKAFEKLVREIGNGRHLIRKAKMAAQAEAFSAGIDDDELDGIADDAVASSMRVMSFRRTTTAASRSNLACGDSSLNLSAFEQVDKALDKAQSLCERAAHQFLRDGDCRLETESAKEAFQNVLERSTEELALLELKEKTSSGKDSNTNATSQSSSTKLGEPQRSGDVSSSGVFANIEVDEDEEQMPVKLPTLRMTSRMGPRKGPN